MALCLFMEFILHLFRIGEIDIAIPLIVRMKRQPQIAALKEFVLYDRRIFDGWSDLALGTDDEGVASLALPPESPSPRWDLALVIARDASR
jgi:hypothetical protein